MVLGVLATIALASAVNTAVSFAAQGLGASPVVIQGLAPQAYVFLTAVGIPGASPVGVIGLMLMHLVVAAIAVPIFQKVLPLPADRPQGAAVRA